MGSTLRKRLVIRCFCSSSSLTLGFALLTCILPNSFIPPPPISYFRASRNIPSNSSSLNLLSISSLFIFSRFSFCYLTFLSYSLPRLPVSCHICVFPFSVCHHKLPVISVSHSPVPLFCSSPHLSLQTSYIPSWAAGFSPPCRVHLLQRWSLSCHHRQLSSLSAHAYKSIYCTVQLDNNTLLVAVNFLFLRIFRDSQCCSEDTYNEYTFLWLW